MYHQRKLNEYIFKMQTKDCLKDLIEMCVKYDSPCAEIEFYIDNEHNIVKENYRYRINIQVHKY